MKQDRLKTLGMIGGTSWHSTIVYYRLINEMAAEVAGPMINPPLILHSLNIEVMRSGDRERIKNTYLETSKKLEKAGAEAIVICANTPHLVYDFVSPKIGIPILHIADATGRAAKKQGLQKLGLLGNRPTMTGDFIPGRLQTAFGISTVIPDEKYLDESHRLVSEELTQGRFTDYARTFYQDRIAELKDKGATGIILGCTELPILFDGVESSLPMLATTQLHAQMAVEFVIGV